MFRPKSIQHQVTTSCVCGAQLKATSYLSDAVDQAHARFLNSHYECRKAARRPVNPVEDGEGLA